MAAAVVPIEIDGGIERRFWQKVSIGDDCFEWIGLRDVKGYGRFSIKRRHLFAHRVAWTVFNGPIPHGLEIDHLCRNRACVRIDHLEPVTHKENLARSVNGVGSINAAKTHCPQNHPYDEMNTYIGSKGARCCKACRSTHNHASYVKRTTRKGH